VHGYIYIYVFIKENWEPRSDKLTRLLILGDEISTLRILGFGRCYNWLINIYPMLGLGLVGGSVTLAFRNACTRKLFVIVFSDSLFAYNFECNLFAFYCFYCLFAVSLRCNCSAYGPMWSLLSPRWSWS